MLQTSLSNGRGEWRLSIAFAAHMGLANLFYRLLAMSLATVHRRLPAAKCEHHFERLFPAPLHMTKHQNPVQGRSCEFVAVHVLWLAFKCLLSCLPYIMHGTSEHQHMSFMYIRALLAGLVCRKCCSSIAAT